SEIRRPFEDSSLKRVVGAAVERVLRAGAHSASKLAIELGAWKLDADVLDTGPELPICLERVALEKHPTARGKVAEVVLFGEDGRLWKGPATPAVELGVDLKLNGDRVVSGSGERNCREDSQDGREHQDTPPIEWCRPTDGRSLAAARTTYHEPPG